MQALRLIFALSLLAACPVRAATPAEQLAAECDALLAAAVRMPYGWAWPADDPEPARLARGASLVSFEPLFTPAAGLVLHLAGRELDDDRYRQAAYHAARGILAAQDASGRVPRTAVFGRTLSRHDPATLLPDRSATTAALGLLLPILQSNPPQGQEMLRRNAARAAFWLSRQQTTTGAWPSLFQPNPDARPIRLIRLDGPDYRNSTLAMLYAAEVLEDRGLLRGADLAVDQLLQLRLTQPPQARGLWQAAYELNGAPAGEPRELAGAVDALAGRYALQTLMYAGLAKNGHRAALAATLPTAQRLAALNAPDGRGWRLHPFEDDRISPAEADAAELFAGQRLIPPVDSDENSAQLRPNTAGSFGLPETLAAAQRMKDTDKHQILASLQPYGGIHHDLARLLVGLSDQPVRLDRPSNPAAAKAFLDHSPELKLPPGDDVPARVRRITALLLRVKLERLAVQ